METAQAYRKKGRQRSETTAKRRRKAPETLLFRTKIKKKKETPGTAKCFNASRKPLTPAGSRIMIQWPIQPLGSHQRNKTNHPQRKYPKLNGNLLVKEKSNRLSQSSTTLGPGEKSEEKIVKKKKTRLNPSSKYDNLALKTHKKTAIIFFSQVNSGKKVVGLPQTLQNFLGREEDYPTGRKIEI